MCGVIAKRFLHAKNQLSVPCSFFNQFAEILIECVYEYTSHMMQLSSKNDDTALCYDVIITHQN